MENQEKLWLKILELVRAEISSGNYKTWFGQTQLGSLTDKKITLKVPSAFVKGQITNRFSDVLNQSISQVIGHDLEIDYQIDSTLFTKSTKLVEEDSFEWGTPTPTPTQNTNLNPRYTMENFVVGLTNNLAYAAAQAVVQNPGVSYNPLYIYGPSGVGKTHLMQAIGNALIKKNPALRVVFATSERFMNDLVQSIQTKTTGEFRSKYRNADVFLIDDIQFIAGRDSTQEEFFHTYNEIFTRNSQIILTSDRAAHEIEKLEDRLRSRFQGGLTVDIQMPDFDTRMAILKQKLTEKMERLDDDCLRVIADTNISSIRDLEGKLTQVLQAVKFQNQQATPTLISQILGEKVMVNTPIDKNKVLSGIQQYFQIKQTDLIGPRRQKELVLPRQIAMYILYTECKIPMEKVGQILGGRDHTTILHGVEKIKSAITRDREIQRLLIEVKSQIST